MCTGGRVPGACSECCAVPRRRDGKAQSGQQAAEAQGPYHRSVPEDHAVPTRVKHPRVYCRSPSAILPPPALCYSAQGGGRSGLVRTMASAEKTGLALMPRAQASFRSRASQARVAELVACVQEIGLQAQA